MLLGNGRDRVLTYASPSFGTVFGLAEADVRGKHLNDVPGVEISAEMAEMTVAAIKAQQPYRDFLCSWRPSPSERKRWVQTNAVPIVDGNGDFRGYRGVCRDITAQIDAEEALRRSEQRFRQLFEIGSDYSSGNGCGLSDELRFAQLRGRRRRSGVGLWTDITAIKRADEKHRQLEEQLHHAQRLGSLGTLAGGVGHELNNTLVPVVRCPRSCCGIYRRTARDRANLQTIVQASDRARDLVKQILACSRKQELRRETFDLAVVAADALSMLRASMPSSIRLEQALPAATLLQGDPGQLHQVIVNLVTNAMHAIGAVLGTITVSLETELDGAHVRLAVSDTVCGMDEATRVRIFEPFFTTKVVGQGTGLGLAVAHGIVTGHGGRIDVESAPGEGTRVSLLFPVQSADAAAST